MADGEAQVTKWRKKPVVIEAMRIDGTPESAFAARQWVEAHGGHVHEGPVPPGSYPPEEGPHGDGWHCRIYTLEGPMLACPGDWIIRGIQGEFYPCKPDIFEASYESVGEDS
jgi:hypothetical protein